MNKSITKKRISQLLALLLVTLVVLLSFTACGEVTTTNPREITSLFNLNGKTIGVVIGSMHEEIIEEQFVGCTIRYYNSAADLVVALTADRVDAIICDGPISYDLVEKNQNFAILGEALSSSEHDFNAHVIIKQYDAANPTIKEAVYNTFLEDNRYELIISGVKTTSIISLCSLFFGAFIGFAYFSFCWSRPKAGLEVKIGKWYIWSVNAIPLLITLMVLYYVVFARTNMSATTVSIIGFTISFTATFEAIIAHAYSTLNHGEEEAALSLGYTPRAIYFKIVVPQIFKVASHDLKNQIVSLIQATSIVGYLTVQDITKVTDIVRSKSFDAFFPLLITTILYFVLCSAVVAIFSFIESRIISRRRSPEKILKGVERE